MPEELVKDLTSNMESAGIPVPDSQERWSMALDALKVCIAATSHHPCLVYDCLAPVCMADNPKTLCKLSQQLQQLLPMLQKIALKCCDSFHDVNCLVF